MNKTLKNVGICTLCLALLLGILWCIPGNVSTAKAAASNNLLADYDFSFENTAVGADPAGWVPFDGSNNVYEVTDAEATNGTHSLKLEIPNTTIASRGIYTPYLNVEGLKSLYLSVDFKCANKGTFFVYFYGADNAQVGDTLSATKASDGDWTTYVRNCEVPAGAKTARVMLYKGGGTVDTIYFDNVIIRDGAYFELNETFENVLSPNVLLNSGWGVFGGCSTDSFAFKPESTGKTLEVTYVGNDLATGIYSPYITLGDATKLSVSADIKMTGSGQVYLYYYNANKAAVDNENRILYGVNNGEWATKSNQWDVPEGAVYARIMLYVGKSGTPTYFDNLVVTPVTQTVTTTAPAGTTAPATTAPATTAPATTAPATTAPATTAPVTTAPATTAPATTAPATTAPATTAAATTAPATSPDTGDNTALGLMIALMTLSVVALVATKAKFGTR